MSSELEQLVLETVELTGAAPPEVLASDAPVLAGPPAAPDDDQAMYLVGLIGGKDVGKSALVNALVGQQITAQTSHGPGTDTAIAYAHQSQAQALRELLDHEIPGRYRIVTHQVEQLQRQVLVDLPDIDSHYADHLALTRRMLRHMLYPIWIQSIEKYADQQPQKLLANVAAGNSPANFIFCLNKADQLDAREGERAVAELRDDYASRLARTLGIAPPRVYAISAIHPERFDLPELRGVLSRQRTVERVRESWELASRQQERTLLNWLAEQRLGERAQRLARLQQEAEELTAGRIGVPLLEQVVPQILDDPGYRAAMVEQIMQQRIARWPVVNLVHTLLAPLYAAATQVIRGKGSAVSLAGAEAMVDSYLQPGGDSVASMVQSTFAHLQQSHPAVSGLYAQRKLWEDLPSDTAAADLRHALVSTIERQRATALSRIAARRGLIAPLVRWLLTIGALLWFPIVQPILEAILRSSPGAVMAGIALLIVQILGVTYLLKAAVFLGIYFLLIWLILRWDTARRVAKLLARWKRVDDRQMDHSLATQVMHWLDSLTAPIRDARTRLDTLLLRTEALRRASDSAQQSPAPAAA